MTRTSRDYIITVVVLASLVFAFGVIARLIAGPKPKHIDPDEDHWWRSIK